MHCSGFNVHFVVLLLQQATGHAEHMGNLVDAIGAGFMPSSSPPPLSAISSASADMGSPNLASSAAAAGGMATARVVRAEQKKFFFDLGSNARGQYLRISEVRVLLIWGCHTNTPSLEVVMTQCAVLLIDYLMSKTQSVSHFCGLVYFVCR
jgi:hypothetical protein